MAVISDLPRDVDVLVVGAGVIGLAHALRALDDGLRVLVIDRDHAPTGASVRNFGHLGATLQAGELGELSRAAREVWIRVGERTGLPVRQVGTIVLAENELELAVLEERAAAAPDEVRLLTADQVQAATTVVGHAGALFPLDLRVDPRTAIPGLADWLAGQPGVDLAWATSYLGHADDTVVRTSRGEVRAARTIVCVGHDVDQLQPVLAAEREVLRCRLQMARVDAALPEVAPALLTATSMLRYSAFTDLPSRAALAADAEHRLADLLGIEANLMMTQLPDGSLLLGDSHATTAAAPPFLAESTYDVLLGAARRLFGRELRVVERWQGIYAANPAGNPVLVHDTSPTTTFVSVTIGLGMTISHALAARTPL